jgi:hypothetical protein
MTTDGNTFNRSEREEEIGCILQINELRTMTKKGVVPCLVCGNASPDIPGVADIERPLAQQAR